MHTKYNTIEEYLEICEKENNKEWFDSLEKRKQDEALFHDQHREEGDKNRANKKWYTTTAKSKNYLDKWIKNNSKNLIFLDYACGFGISTITASTGLPGVSEYFSGKCTLNLVPTFPFGKPFALSVPSNGTYPIAIFCFFSG